MTARDPAQVERQLMAYYDQEADDRAGRPLDARRLTARAGFLARLGSGCRVLEVGPGAGRDAVAFADAGCEVTGVDLSFEQLRHAARGGLRPVVATARALPFRDARFDVLWTMSALMHVPDVAIEPSLVELRRVLAPGALAAIGTWGGPDIETHGDKDRFDPPRLFSRRSDERWTSLLGLLGTVDHFENWHPDTGDFWYQWALVEVPT